MSSYRVSVVVRTFNRPQMLRRALESIRAQTWPDVEAVVVNDGGEDIQSIIDDFSDKMDVTYLNFSPEDKPGRCAAATHAIEAGTGDWICYLDDDDFYQPHHCETLMKAAQENTEARVFYTDALKATETPDGDGEYEVTDVSPGPSEDFSRSGFYFGVYIHLSTFCHHKDVFRHHGGFDPDLPVLEDLDLYFRYAHDHDFVHIPVVTAQFNIRTDETNAVTAMRREFQETREALCKKYIHMAITDLIRFCDEGMARLLGFAEKQDAFDATLKEFGERLDNLERRSGGNGDD